MAAKPKLIVIAGPTAVGKTGIAIELAKQLNTEIISADSRQCYQGMAIGTAQPSAAERLAIPHHFIDCFPPEKALTAADFEHISLNILADIFRRKETAIVCGGTGLYIKALCEGLDEMPPVDEEINRSVNQLFSENGIEWLKDELKKTDPEFFIGGETENPARMLRALTFHLSCGKSITQFRTGIKKERPFDIVKTGLELPREILYNRINLRVDKMMEEGLLEEVKSLFDRRNLKNLNTVGYSELFDYLEGKVSLDFAIDKIKQHSRNYAKRQLTWFKRDHEFQWMDANDPEIIEKIISIL
ncbi:MAG: tRNA (adenosine(37)-N6)-dimethylallyltransferase MiaA [Chitinophagaceae bacterium]|jgi:tRNA dimethylallyltransferase